MKKKIGLTIALTFIMALSSVGMVFAVGSGSTIDGKPLDEDDISGSTETFG